MHPLASWSQTSYCSYQCTSFCSLRPLLSVQLLPVSSRYNIIYLFSTESLILFNTPWTIVVHLWLYYSKGWFIRKWGCVLMYIKLLLSSRKFCSRPPYIVSAKRNKRLGNGLNWFAFWPKLSLTLWVVTLTAWVLGPLRYITLWLSMCCLVLWLTMCQQFSFSRARAKFSFFLFLVHAMGLSKFVRLASKTTLQNSYFYERNVLPPQSLSGGGTTTGSRIIHQIVFQVICALGKVGAHFSLCVWCSPQCPVDQPRDWKEGSLEGVRWGIMRRELGHASGDASSSK